MLFCRRTLKNTSDDTGENSFAYNVEYLWITWMSLRSAHSNLLPLALHWLTGAPSHSTIAQKSSLSGCVVLWRLRPGTAMFAAGSRDRDWDCPDRDWAAWAEWLQLRLSVSGFHWPLLALARVILRLRVNSDSGSDTSHSLSVVSSDCSRHLTRHWAQCELNIGLKFRLRWCCVCVCSPWPRSQLSHDLGVDLQPLARSDQSEDRECSLRDWVTRGENQDPEDKERGSDCLARGEYVSGFTCSIGIIHITDRAGVAQGQMGGPCVWLRLWCSTLTHSDKCATGSVCSPTSGVLCHAHWPTQVGKICDNIDTF